MKKTIAGYVKADGTFEPQMDVEVGPLEEEAILADWALGEHTLTKPLPMSLEEKVNALSDPTKGLMYISSFVTNIQKQYAIWGKRIRQVRF